MRRPFLIRPILLFGILALLASAAAAQPSRAEYDEAPRVRVPAPREDFEKADRERAGRGQVSHFAVQVPVQIAHWSPKYERGWQVFQEGEVTMARLRLRIDSPGALSLSLRIDPFRMPAGGKLSLYSKELELAAGPFTEADNEAHGELWTPPILGDGLLLELELPLNGIPDLGLEITSVQHGYAGFGEPEPKAEGCHLDVTCEEAQVWGDEIRSVGLLTVEGVRFCSGFLVNNTREDGRPLFMTAAHCGITRENDSSVVVFWNHESAECRERGAEPETEGKVGSLEHFQTGARLLATIAESDAVLLELDDPPRPEHDVYFAGWDRSKANPLRAAVIHHPNTDAKRISFDSSRSWTTSYLQHESPGEGTHIRVGDWEIGSTQGGSSGSPLFNQNRHVVGQLHGGFASCSNEEADWFGRLSFSWTGEGTPETRLSDYLDPIGKGVYWLDGRDHSDLPGRE